MMANAEVVRNWPVGYSVRQSVRKNGAVVLFVKHTVSVYVFLASP